MVAFVALYGAILSTVTCIRQNREKQVKIKVNVELNTSITLYKDANPDEFVIEAANIGLITTTIYSCSVLHKKQIFTMHCDSLPFRFTPGECWSDKQYLVFLHTRLREAGCGDIIHIRVQLSDGAGRKFISKPLKLILHN